METLLLFLFGGAFVLAVARRRGAARSVPAVVAPSAEPAGNGNIVILFFVMLAMMFVMMRVAA